MTEQKKNRFTEVCKEHIKSIESEQVGRNHERSSGPTHCTRWRKQILRVAQIINPFRRKNISHPG